MRKRLLLLGLLAAAAVTVWATGLHAYADVASLRAAVERAGWWGPLLFVLLFGLEGLGVPGIFFMLVAVTLWPPWFAFLCNWLGALHAGAVGFLFARSIGRDWIAAHLPERARRFERRVVERSLQTVIVIRLLFFLAPWAHWALGLSPVGWRPFLLGSAIGLAPMLLLVSFTGGPLLEWLAQQSRELWLNCAAAALFAAIAWRTWRWLRRAPQPAGD